MASFASTKSKSEVCLSCFGCEEKQASEKKKTTKGILARKNWPLACRGFFEMVLSGRRWLTVIGGWALFLLWIDRNLILQNFRVQRVILGEGELSISSRTEEDSPKGDSGATNRSANAIPSTAGAAPDDRDGSTKKCPGDKCSGIFDPDPFRDFHSELDWIPNRTLIPWAQLNRRPPCILEPVGVDPFNGKRQRQHAKQGILYIKLEKAASTTLAGVAGRIAHKLFDLVNASATADKGVKPVCRVRLTHAWSRQLHKPFAVRDHDKSFLFTFVRHPGRRSLSEFYYFGVDGRNATGNETEPTAMQAIEYLRHPKHVNSQFHNCADKGIRGPPGDWTWQQKKAWQIQRVVDELDYIGVVERMDESLVGLQLMLGLRPSDVLIASSKESNTYMDRKGNNKCYFIYKHPMVPEIEKYMESNEYRELNYADELLYRVANANLNRLIDVVGKATFRDALDKFRHAKARMERDCPQVVHKCDSDGNLVPLRNRSTCYWKDAGCGFECVDNLFDQGKKRAWIHSSTTSSSLVEDE